MQKKLLAAAVLSTFAGVAGAQSANVVLYGLAVPNFESASATGADNSTIANNGSGVNSSVRALTGAAGPANQSSRSRFNPAGTNFGIRGSEDLGNGLSYWFQYENAVQSGNTPPNVGTTSGTALTSRNTGVGLRSTTWGTVFTGIWDTPFNQMYGMLNANGRTGGPATVFNSNLLGTTVLANGAYSAQSVGAWCSAAVSGIANSVSCTNYGTNFDRRDNNQLQWWSPNWNGFEVKASYNVVSDSNAVTADNRAAGAIKPTAWDLTLAYTNGPLAVGYAYERQKDRLAYAAANASFAGGIAFGNGTGAFTITPATVSGSTGTGHRLGARYSFALGGGSSIGIGGLWESLKYTLSYTGQAAAVSDLSELKKTAWRLQGNFATGAHFFGLEYAKANETKGSIVNGTAATNQFNSGGTAARGILLSYDYMMSKRTSAGLYYMDVRNEANASYSGPVFAGIATAPGADPKYYGIRMRHTF